MCVTLSRAAEVVARSPVSPDVDSKVEAISL